MQYSEATFMIDTPERLAHAVNEVKRLIKARLTFSVDASTEADRIGILIQEPGSTAVKVEG
jgi:hypothetical protein